MISWIQTIIERKGRWIFILLLAVIIVAFVFTIGNTPGFVGSETSTTFYGHKLSRNSKDVRELSNNAIMSSYLHYGRAPFSDQFLQVEIYRRASYLHLADQLNLPSPNKKQLQTFIKTFPAVNNSDGEFDSGEFNRILDRISTDTSLDPNKVESVLAEDYRMEKVLKLVGEGSFVLKLEAQWDAIRAETKHDLDLVTFDKTNFNPEIKIEETALENYYKDNKVSFRVPEKIKLSYLVIPDSNFGIAPTSLTQEQIDQHFDRNSFRYVDANAEPKVTSFGELTEDIQNQLKENLIQELQQEKSSEFSNNFVLNLFQSEIVNDSEAYRAYLEKNDLQEIALESFSREGMISHPVVPQQELRNAFSLSEKKYFSSPFRVAEGQGILIFKGNEKPYIPEFKELSKEVEESYLSSQKNKLFVTNGNKYATKIKELSALEDEEKALDDFLNTEGLVRKKIESATLSSSSAQIPTNVFSAAVRLKPNAYSSFIAGSDEGHIVRILSSTPPEGEELDTLIESQYEQLKSTYNYIFAQSLFSELVDKGLDSK
jgi:peptidyl-prolyl cis-trans isomerase D